MKYAEFLESKQRVAPSCGFEAGPIHHSLYDFQAAIVKWALRKGRAAIFADCGLGKSFMQVEWAHHVARHSGRPVLIVAPLCVAEQTIGEAGKLGYEVIYARDRFEVSGAIVITNYERISAFDAEAFGGLVLDESSILKSIDGKTKDLLIERFATVPYKLCCTATPCPNDIAELANHAEFLNVMSRRSMMAAFFVHDDEGWRLRGHAKQPFYRWLTSWAMMLKSPADIGFDGSRFKLPELRIQDHVVVTEWRKPGHLFAGEMSGITDRASVRRQSVDDRVRMAAEIANTAEGQVIVWCGLNDESAKVAKAIPDSVEIVGSDDPDVKRGKLYDFIAGKTRVQVSKVSISGFGMNFQNASTMIFLGMSDSYEEYYQAIRRCWRFGQIHPVRIHIVVTDHEVDIVDNVRRKEAQANELSREIMAESKDSEMRELGMVQTNQSTETGAVIEGANWKILRGDTSERINEIEENSIDLSVFSPPFLSLYQYSNTERDLGNCADMDTFFTHFKYTIDGLFRITKPGRIACVHVAQVAATIINNGFIGMIDFRGRLIQEFSSAGWVYHGDVCIDKDPQAQAIRTHSKGLLFTQLKKDSSWLRPAMADYIVVFRKPGENAVPIHPDINNEQWIEWARPIWYGIRESDTLNPREARAEEDDRHICPLQLGTIERCIRLWSNPGETVFSPFAGIGSEGYVAVENGRRFIGIELNELYAKTAAKNLGEAERITDQQSSLFAAAT